MNDNGFEVFRGFAIALGAEAIVVFAILAAIAFNSSHIVRFMVASWG